VTQEIQKQRDADDSVALRRLTSYLTINGKGCNPAEISQLVDGIVQLMEIKKAWLGTPKEEDIDALDAFYLAQLLEFENFVHGLKKKKVHAIIGSLTSIVEPRILGLCATAYQCVIAQQRAHVEEESADCSIDKIMESAAMKYLEYTMNNLIKHMSSTRLGVDVHVEAQYRYALGFADVPDALTAITVQQAQINVIRSLDLMFLITNAAEYLSTTQASLADVFDWIKQQTPPEFDEGYLFFRNVMKVKEGELLFRCQKRLIEAGMSTQQTSKILESFVSSRTADLNSLSDFLNLNESAKTEGLKKVLGKATDSMIADSGIEKAATFQGLIEALKKLKKTCKALVDFEQVEIKQNQRARNDLVRVIRKTALFIESLANFAKIMESLGIANETRLEVLSIKSDYEKGINGLGQQINDQQELEVSFLKAEFPLPSDNIENARRNAYNANFSGKKAVFKALKVLGIIVENDKTTKMTYTHL